MTQVALYARVSTDGQAQTDTIASQISALENRISEDGYTLQLRFIDNGYSGSNLIRPGLEMLRDKVAAGEVDKIYIHSPDRLSRKYAYQMILLEEFKNAGAEVIFLNFQTNDNPESQLLLQMQGMIAEYERTKILERSRRGRIHAAKKGFANAIGAAPYGYFYIDIHDGGGRAQYRINEKEAEIVRKIFHWIGHDRLSLRKVCDKLRDLKIPSPKGNPSWNSSSVRQILQNPSYKGQAAFGKTKIGPKLPIVRPQKNASNKSHCSTYKTDKKDWIYIPVPAIIDEDLFAIIEEQIAENAKRARVGRQGVPHLLQGLVVCNRCHYAYCGKPSQVIQRRGRTITLHAYYRCTGGNSYRFSGNKICDNKPIREDILDIAVWEEVKMLLNNPNRLLNEFQRRIANLEKNSSTQTTELLEKQKNKIKRSISLLIDSYTQEHINKEEFEPRIKLMKQNLETIEEQQKKITDQKELKNELTLIVTNVGDFASKVKSGLDAVDLTTKRDIIRTLVKRVEINHEEVNIVFRIKELPFTSGDGNIGQQGSTHCARRHNAEQWRVQIHKFHEVPIRFKLPL